MRPLPIVAVALLAALPLPALGAPGAAASAWSTVKGWPVRGYLPRGTPTLADLNGDRRLELVTLATTPADPSQFLVLVLRADGKQLKGWPQPAGMIMPNPAGPVVGDVDGDGKPEVVVTDGARVGTWGADGRPRVAAPIPGGGCEIHTHGDAVLADLDGDGRLELVFATWSRGVYALRLARGVEHLAGSPVELAGPFGAAPAAADLDGDGRDEVVVPDESGACFLIRWRAEGPLVERARDRDGAPLKLTSRAAPVIADLGDGAGLAVLLGTNEGRFFALDAGGVERWRFQIPERNGASASIVAAPIVADLLGDGRREVVFAAFDGMLRALAADGRELPGWGSGGLDRVLQGLVAADLDGDGREDIVVPDDGGVLHFLGADPGPVAGPCVWPLLGDIDADGRLELIVPRRGVGFDAFRLAGSAAPPASWPLPRGNARHSGTAPRPAVRGEGAR